MRVEVIGQATVYLADLCRGPAGDRIAEMAARLSKHADRLCEQNMAERTTDQPGAVTP